VQRVGNYAKQQFSSLIADYPSVFEDLRGEGLMLGLKMRVSNTEFIDALRAHGMLAIAAGDNVVRLLPSLIIDESHVREAMEKLTATAGQYEAG
jgi:acetylornithine/N-succinyldiaminopimelate aminotransferase